MTWRLAWDPQHMDEQAAYLIKTDDSEMKYYVLWSQGGTPQAYMACNRDTSVEDVTEAHVRADIKDLVTAGYSKYSGCITRISHPQLQGMIAKWVDNKSSQANQGPIGTFLYGKRPEGL